MLDLRYEKRKTRVQVAPIVYLSEGIADHPRHYGASRELENALPLIRGEYLRNGKPTPFAEGRGVALVVVLAIFALGSVA